MCVTLCMMRYVTRHFSDAELEKKKSAYLGTYHIYATWSKNSNFWATFICVCVCVHITELWSFFQLACHNIPKLCIKTQSNQLLPKNWNNFKLLKSTWKESYILQIHSLHHYIILNLCGSWHCFGGKSLPFTTEVRVQSQVSPSGICDGQTGNVTVFYPNASVFPRQHHSTGAPCLIIHHQHHIKSPTDSITK
jgi:hypothetical protein